MFSRFFLAAFFLCGIFSCTKNAPSLGQENQLSTLVEKGRRSYLVNCTACHNPDPKKPGVIGPELWGSAQELIKKRVMEAAYPEGYQPKRTTKTMAAMPYLKDDLEALHAFLNAP